MIIAGSRSFVNYHLFVSFMEMYMPKDLSKLEIVSGGAIGTDIMGELYAKANNIPCKVFPADWDKFGKRAGYVRNEEMAKYAKACMCFWDGESKGTKHMIDLAKQYKLNLKVVMVK